MKKRKVGLKEGSFENLPKDMICYEIFSFLETEEVVGFGYLNKQFYEYANENSVWRMLFNANTFKKRLIETDDIVSFKDDENWKEKYKKYYKLCRSCTFKKSMIKSSYKQLQELKKFFKNYLQLDFQSILSISEEEFNSKINITETIFKRKKLNYGYILDEKNDETYEIFHPKNNIKFEGNFNFKKEQEGCMIEGKLFLNDGKYIETSRGTEGEDYYNFKTPKKDTFYSYSSDTGDDFRNYGNYNGQGNEFYDFKHKNLPLEKQIEIQIEEFKSYENHISDEFDDVEYSDGFFFKGYYNHKKIEKSIKQAVLENICDVYKKECLKKNNINPLLKLNSTFRVQKLIKEYFFLDKNICSNLRNFCCINIYSLAIGEDENGKTIYSENTSREKVMKLFEDHYNHILQNFINILFMQCFKQRKRRNYKNDLDRLLYNRKYIIL